MGRNLKFVFTILIIFLLVLVIMPTSSGIDVNIVIDLEINEYTYELEPDDPGVLCVNGSITCEFEGLGSEVKYVEVNLYLGDWLG